MAPRPFRKVQQHVSRRTIYLSSTERGETCLIKRPVHASFTPFPSNPHRCFGRVYPLQLVPGPVFRFREDVHILGLLVYYKPLALLFENSVRSGLFPAGDCVHGGERFVKYTVIACGRIRNGEKGQRRRYEQGSHPNLQSPPGITHAASAIVQTAEVAGAECKCQLSRGLQG